MTPATLEQAQEKVHPWPGGKHREDGCRPGRLVWGCQVDTGHPLGPYTDNEHLFSICELEVLNVVLVSFCHCDRISGGNHFTRKTGLLGLTVSVYGLLVLVLGLW